MKELLVRTLTDPFFMTLREVWEQKYQSDFVAGVNMLRTRRELVTPRVWQRLVGLAESKEYVPPFDLAKLRTALENGLAKEESVMPILTTAATIKPGRVQATAETIQLHKQHSHHHAMMVAATTDEERARHATIIMEEILPELDRLYDLQRAAMAGEVGREENPLRVTKTAITDYQKLGSINTRISRLRRLIREGPNLIRKSKLQTQLEEKIAERDRIKGLL